MEFHGDACSLFLGCSYLFDTVVDLAPFGVEFATRAAGQAGFCGGSSSRAWVEELADAILNHRPHRCEGRMAQHIVEVIESIHTSAETGNPVTVGSSLRGPRSRCRGHCRHGRSQARFPPAQSGHARQIPIFR